MRAIKNARLLVVGSAVALVLAAIVACGGSDDTKSGSTAKVDVKSTTSAAGGDGQSSTTIHIVMTDNVFTPKEITVPVGKTVEFEAKNQGQALHNMHILSQSAEGKDFQTEGLVNPGAESEFTAKFTKAGTIKFQCDIHLPDMVGTITVK